MKRCADFICAVCIIVLTALLFALPVSGAENAAEGITSARLVRMKDSFRIDFRASLRKEDAERRKGQTLYVFEFYPYQSVAHIKDHTPVAQVKASENMSFSLGFDHVSGAQRLYSKFLLAYKSIDGTYSVIGGAHYIDNPELIAVETYDYPTYASKKGLIVQLTGDAQELGISHTVINLAVNEYLLAEKTADSVDYVYENTTYYLNREKLERLDYRIRQFTEAGIHCYLNIILTRPAAGMHEKLLNLYAEPDFSKASLYAFNMSNRESVMYLESFLDFIARRYTSKERRYGFAGSFILGYEVNRNRDYNYMGPESLDSYLNSYIAAFRVAYTALRSVYSNGRVYLPIGNNFTAATAGPSAAADPTLDYPAKDLLLSFAAKVRFSGDIQWHLAASAYPSDPDITDFRQDPGATAKEDTPYISMANIEVLCDFMGKDEFLYNGNRRSIAITEFGINADAESTALRTQAAVYALAYYKTEFNPYIESLIYHRHVDNSDEAGLYYGLWTRTDNSLCTPADIKQIYTTFKYIDTQMSLSTTSYAPGQLGAADWSELIENFDEKKLTKRRILNAVSTDADAIKNKQKGEILYDFTANGLSGFYPSDNADYIELRSGAMDDLSMLYAKMYSLYPTEYMGIGSYFDKPMDIRKSGYISVKINAVAPENVSEVSLMVRLYSNGVNGKPAVTYEGVTTLKTDVWSEIGFDISEISAFTDTIDGIKIWIKPTDNIYREGEYGFWLHSISMYGKSIPLLLTIFLWLVLITVILAAALLIFLIIRNSVIRRNILKRRAEAEAKYLLLKEQRRRASLSKNPPQQRPSGGNSRKPPRDG